jgi:hypothetical protein
VNPTQVGLPAQASGWQEAQRRRGPADSSPNDPAVSRGNVLEIEKMQCRRRIRGVGTSHDEATN